MARHFWAIYCLYMPAKVCFWGRLLPDCYIVTNIYVMSRKKKKLRACLSVCVRVCVYVVCVHLCNYVSHVLVQQWQCGIFPVKLQRRCECAKESSKHSFFTVKLLNQASRTQLIARIASNFMESLIPTRTHTHTKMHVHLSLLSAP